MDCNEIITCIQVNDHLLVSEDNANLLRVLKYIQNINNSVIYTENIKIKLEIESELECEVTDNELFEAYRTKICQETIKRKNGNLGLTKVGSKRKIKGLETTLLSSPLSSSSSSSSTPSSSSSFSSSSAIKSPISFLTPPNKRNK